MAADEANYETSTTVQVEHDTSNQFSTIKNISTDVSSNDDLNINTNKEMKDDSSKQEKPLKRQMSDVFQLDESYHEKNMSFLDRLFHQLTRPSAAEVDDRDDQVFIDANNHNEFVDDRNQTNDNISIFGAVRSFIGELNEEKNFIIGTIDEPTLVNRRQGRKAKSIISLITNN